MRAHLASSAFIALLLGCNGCDNGASSSGATTAASSAAPAPSAHPSASAKASAAPMDPNGPIDSLPIPQSAVAKVVNPGNDPKYEGPFGELHGVVKIEGEPPPSTNVRVPPKCGEAAATYGKLFRVGIDKALADALVTVTSERGKGYVPELNAAQSFTIHGCALNTRTIAVTFGQRIDILNKEESATSYMPYLDGAGAGAVMVAVPQGDAVKLYPTEAKSHYAIKDQLPNPFLTADVFVLAYPTHAVTGVDGKYDIKRVPVGHAKVTAYLPAIDKFVEKDFEIKEGDNALDMTLTYDPKAGGAPSGSASAASAPGASGSAKAPPPKK